MKIPVLELRHVYKSFSLDGEKIDILKDINLVINKGDFLSIMGPSGSGKSTLMYLIGCLDKPTSGQLIIERVDVSNFSEKQLSKIRNSKIGFVFQMFNLLPRTTALANILLPIIYSKGSMKEAKIRALNLMEEMGIGKRADQAFRWRTTTGRHRPGLN